jgi:hypothetical protein
MVCDEPVGRSHLTLRVEALAGLTACKRCIDAATFALITGKSSANRLASQLAVIFDARRKAAKAVRRRQHVAA